jgi:hypothetical protein
MGSVYAKSSASLTVNEVEEVEAERVEPGKEEEAKRVRRWDIISSAPADSHSS